MQEFKLLINGQLLAGDANMSVINPATGAPLADCPRASAAQADQAIAAAKAAFPSWSSTPIADRRARILRLADAMQVRKEELARLLTQEQGKPIKEAGGEISASIAFLRHFADIDLAPRLVEDSATRRIEQRHKPLGVVALIVPWNFPVLMVCGKLGPALITGNTVLIKPAPTTPLCTLVLGELCAEIFPAGVVNVIADQNDLGAHITAHPDVRKVSFTGSSATGRKVMASAADSIKRITLELGGNDAAIVLDDVDPEKTAPALFNRAFNNNGQVCLAIKRLYVHESIYDRMVNALATQADAAVVGDGLDPATRFGPVQNRTQFDKVRGLIEDARKTGTIVAGGEVAGSGGYFIRPTIVRDVKDGDRIVEEEQFGPVLPVLKYSDPADAVRRANASPYGLGGSVWGKDLQRAEGLATQLDAGTVWVNTHQETAPHIPFGGAKQSGLGVEYGEEGVAEFTQLQIVSVAKPKA